jgi:hypothetical protein
MSAESILINRRPCGPLPSKKFPDAYLKDELVDLATKKLGLTKNQATKMSKTELCERLSQGLTKDDSPPKPVKKMQSKVDILYVNGRPCGPLPSKKYPEAYLKDELVDLAVDLLGISHNKADKMTKNAICLLLESSESKPKGKKTREEEEIRKPIKKKTRAVPVDQEASQEEETRRPIKKNIRKVSFKQEEEARKPIKKKKRATPIEQEASQEEEQDVSQEEEARKPKRKQIKKKVKLEEPEIIGDFQSIEPKVIKQIIIRRRKPIQGANLGDITTEDLPIKNVLPDPPSIKQLDTLSSFFKKKLDKYYEFRGSYVLEWGWLLWLQKNLPDGFMCIWKDKSNDNGFFYSDSTGQFTIKSWVIPGILKCASKANVRFVVGVLTIKTRADVHANAFIFDMQEHILTRFEPHGAEVTLYDSEKLDRAVRKWLKVATPEIGTWTYRPPPDYCFSPGPQARESWIWVEEAFKTHKVWGKTVRKEAKGFCAAWSLLYIHLRVTNPDFTDQELYEYFTKLSDQELSLMIRQYAEFIVSSIDPKLLEETTDDLHVGDYVKYERPGSTLYGRILEIKGKNSITWIIDRGPRMKFHFAPTLIKLSDQIRIDDDDQILRDNIDQSLRQQAKNPKTGSKDWSQFVPLLKKIIGK